MTDLSMDVTELVALWAALVSVLVLVLACMGVFLALIMRLSAAL